MTVAVRNTHAPEGRTFVRSLIARTLHSNDLVGYASQRWGVAAATGIQKAAMSAIATGDVGSPESREFFSLAVQESLLGRIQGIRRVPFNIRFTRQTAATAGHWVAEGAAIPLSKSAVLGGALPSMKVAALTTATREALEAMGEVTEAALQRDLVDAVAGALDATFINPAWAGNPGESPASVTSGGIQIASTGDVRQDVEALFRSFGGNLRRAYIVMNPLTAVQIGLVDAQVGDTKLGVNGGVLAGVPVLCSEHVPFDSDGGSITLLDASAIAYAARDIDFSVATEATLEMADDPTNNSVVPTATDVVNLWQTNTVAWKVYAEANWAAQGTGKVVTITGVDYPLGS